MSDKNFVHLHVHTEFSLLDGLSRVDKLVKRAKEMNQPAVAITDHGAMFGVIDFYRAAKGAGVKPIIGMETYLAPRTMADKDSVLDKKPFHLLLLAKDQQGYQNLLKIASISQLEGYYYRPRIDIDTLARYSEGIVATSGCLAAKVPQLVMKGHEAEAREWVGKFQDIFGAENFYLELQQHDIPEIRVLNQWLHDYVKSGHSPVGLVATSDVHYVRKEDFEAHDMLLCIQTGAIVTMPKRKDHDNEEGAKTRMAMSDNSYYLYSTEEMWDIFGAEMPEAIHNSVKIAEMCNVDLDSKGYHLPVFPVPEGFDSATYLRYLCNIGLDWRYGSRKNDAVFQERLNYELDVIGRMGFETYFLIVWDLTQFAAHADIWWNVRGSGAGSLVAYCLGITLVDPIQNSLLFERFLNPGRISMPDIDIDFPDDRRGEMIAYAARKYGEDKVASIITFGTMGAKAAIKDVARAMDIPLSEVNRVVNLIPTEAKQKAIEEYVSANPDLQKIYDEEQHLRAVIDMAKQLQGVNRHSSVHAAGVIIADKPLDEYLPLQRVTGKDPSEGALKAVTQFPMETCESLGLLKVDFLGLSTLTIMRRACELIERYHGIHYDLNNVPYRHDDPRLTEQDRQDLDRAFELMGRGETVGVFQLESSGMQQMLRDMRPKEFANIVAGVALYRPGPMDLIPTYNKRLHGDEAPVYAHPKLQSVLGETYGIIIYQEQIMEIAGKLFDYELGEADTIRKAVSKKKDKELAKHKEIFLERGPKNEVDEATAVKIFDDIMFFANYGFNKCVTADTEIVDADTGHLVKVGDLAAGKTQVEYTLTCDTDRMKLQPGKITAVMENGVKPVYLLTTQLGRQIKATDNHPFYTVDGWRNLGELQPGDQVAVPRRIPIEGKLEKKDLKAYALSLVESVLESGAASTKRIPVPDEVFALTNAQILEFFAVLYAERGFTGMDMDEHELDKWGLDELSVFFAAASKQNAQQLKHLLLRVGVMSRIVDSHLLVIEETPSREIILKAIQSQLKTLDYKQYDIALHTVNFILEDIKNSAGTMHHAPTVIKNPTFLEESADLMWDAVVSIEYKGDQATYDLTIDGTHNFIANDILVHNSHATDYAMVTVQTAFLKAHYPVEYMTAMLSVHRDDSAKISHFLEECRRMHIPILPPDVNYSNLDFDIEAQEEGQRGIRFGLAGIKNAGESAVTPIIRERMANGGFDTLEDFCRRVDLRHVGKRTLESLIKVGALVKFGTRAQLVENLDTIMSFSINYHREKDSAQMSLFGGAAAEALNRLILQPIKNEPSNREMLTWEKELLGLYVTGRPADKVRNELSQLNTHSIAEMKEEKEKWHDKTIHVAGEIVSIRKVFTKKGDAMGVLQFEDWRDAAAIEIVLFPRAWEKTQAQRDSGDLENFDVGSVVRISGKFDGSRGDGQIIGEMVSQNFTLHIASEEAPTQYTRRNTWAPEEESAPPPPKNGSNGHHVPKNGNGNHEPNPNNWRTAIAVEEEVIIGRTAPQDWSMTDDDELFVEEQKPVSRRVVVYFNRSENVDRDRNRLRKVINILHSYPGHDRFEIHIDKVEPDMKPRRMEFPDKTTGFSEALLHEVEELVGKGNVDLED